MSEAPPPPRWVYPLLAACAVALTAAGSYCLVLRASVGRYAYVEPAQLDVPAVVDTRTGALCPIGAPCTAPALHR